MADSKCAHCGHKNPPTAGFCGDCGRSLPAGQRCGRCGYADNPAEAAFCIQCGRKLGRRSPAVFMWAGGAVFLASLIVAAILLWQTGLLEEWSGLELGGRADLPAPTRQSAAVANRGAAEMETPAAATLASPTPWSSATPPPTATATPLPTATTLPTETPTARPTTTPSPIPTATPTVTPSPRPTQTATRTVVPTATAVPSPSPVATPCTIAVYGAFRSIWEASQSKLGCAISAARGNIGTAWENFQRGQMLWRQDDGKIYVLYNTGRWERYNDTWNESLPEFTCGVPTSPPTPKRGFGRVWCGFPAVQQGIGEATDGEWGESGLVQLFAGGWMHQTGSGRVYAFFNDGTWRR